jgi:hypothetical protein
LRRPQEYATLAKASGGLMGEVEAEADEGHRDRYQRSTSAGRGRAVMIAMMITVINVLWRKDGLARRPLRTSERPLLQEQRSIASTGFRISSTPFRACRFSAVTVPDLTLSVVLIIFSLWRRSCS